MPSQGSAPPPAHTPDESNTAGPPPAEFNMARYCIGDPAGRTPDKVALVVVHGRDERATERWTFAQLDQAVRAVSCGLRSQGLAYGDRVLIRLDNTSSYPIVFFGAIAAGLVAVPTSPQLTADEVRFLVEDSRASLVVVAEHLRVGVAGVAMVDEGQVAAWCAAGERTAYADTLADDPAFLVYTSGTTDRPKGVLHAQRSAWGRRPMYAHWLGLRADDVMLHAGSFNWTYTLGVGLTDPWANGACAVVYNGPKDPGVWPWLVEHYGATIFAAVPGVYRQWLGRWDPAADLSTLRHGVVAGEALTASLWREWHDVAGTELYEALGMSEISTFVSSGPTVPTRPGSPGKPQPGRRVVVLPLASGEPGERAMSDGHSATPLPPGEVGLLAVHRSDPGLMLGYWRRPQEDAATTRGEWFVSADLVHVEPDGYMIYHGRDDDVMTAQGYRISPVEVEHALAGFPGAAEIAVTEIEVREGVRVVTAFVIPADRAGPAVASESFDAAALLAYARSRLAAYKCPRRVVVVERLPRTANGKIRRRDLSG